MIVDYTGILSVDLHEKILSKAIAIFEDDALMKTNLRERVALRPDLTAWKNYRAIIVHWMTHIRPCAEADLTPEDFELLEQAVLQGDAMDAQIIEVFENFPKKFHVAMLPDVRASMKDDIEEHTAEADIATNELWQAQLNNSSRQN